MYTIQPLLLPLKDFFASDSNDRLVIVLSTLDLEPLLVKLDNRKGRGRRGYSIRSMLYAVIAGWVYDLHSMAALRRELIRNGSLRLLCDIYSMGQVPSEDAFCRFFARLAEHGDEVERLHASTVAEIMRMAPEVGQHVAIDSTAINAWSDGNRREASDPDARWGCKGHQAKGKSPYWFGYKLHIAGCTKAELPLSFILTSAEVGDSTQAISLLERLDRVMEMVGDKDRLDAAMADAQYDSKEIHHAIWERGALPIIDFNDRGWLPPDGYTDDYKPLCDCQVPMRYLGRDRKYVKYGSGPDCTCREGRLIRRFRIDDDIRLHPPLPRHTKKWERLYNERSAIERINSRGKEHGRWRTLRHRGRAKAFLHCALTMVIMAAGYLGMMRAGRADMARSIVRLVA